MKQRKLVVIDTLIRTVSRRRKLRRHHQRLQPLHRECAAQEPRAAGIALLRIDHVVAGKDLVPWTTPTARGLGANGRRVGATTWRRPVLAGCWKDSGAPGSSAWQNDAHPAPRSRQGYRVGGLDVCYNRTSQHHAAKREGTPHPLIRPVSPHRQPHLRSTSRFCITGASKQPRAYGVTTSPG